MKAYQRMKVACCEPEAVFQSPAHKQLFYNPGTDQLYCYDDGLGGYGHGWHLMAPDIRRYRQVLQYHYDFYRATMEQYAKEVLDSL